MDNSIGDRVARLIPRGEQGRVAAAVGMTPDALSRAIHGQRGFGAAELMRIADHFDADLHTLISGEPDPRRPRLVARHDYDQSTRTRSIPGHSADRPILDDITLAYRQALLAPREGREFLAATEYWPGDAEVEMEYHAPRDIREAMSWRISVTAATA